ncbi:MAG: VTT domain-containing protein [Hyphomicrobiales bacterium]
MSSVFAMIESFAQFAQSFAELTASLGAIGLLFFVAVYILVVLLFLPITPFSLAAGAIFGWWGIPIAYFSAVVGSIIAFSISRGLCKEYAAKICAKRPLVGTLERVVVKGGFRLILLIRLSGVLPFAVQNYAFGLTALDRRSYIWASLIGLLPGAIIKVWIGKTSMDVLAGDLFSSWVSVAGLLFALVATILMLVYIGVLAKRELRAEGISLSDSKKPPRKAI